MHLPVFELQFCAEKKSVRVWKKKLRWFAEPDFNCEKSGQPVPISRRPDKNSGRGRQIQIHNFPSTTGVKLGICVSDLLPQLQRRFDLARKAGSMSSGQQSLRSRRRTRIIQSSLLLSREKLEAGERRRRALKRFAWFSTSRKGETHISCF